jgi:hypothetical protein
LFAMEYLLDSILRILQMSNTTNNRIGEKELI